MLAVYPSLQFPCAPQISITHGEEWLPTPAANAIIGLSSDLGENVFHPNLLVFWSRFGIDYTIDDAIRDVTTTYSSVDSSSKIIHASKNNVDDDSVWIAEFVFDDPQLGTLVQTMSLNVVSIGARFRDLIHACGTCTSSQVNSHLLSLRQMVQSLVIEV